MRMHQGAPTATSDSQVDRWQFSFRGPISTAMGMFGIDFWKVVSEAESARNKFGDMPRAQLNSGQI